MIPDGNVPAAREAGDARFTNTHWSVVLAAAGADSPAATRALTALCESYWYPLYAFVRRSGYTPEDAQDLTQEFFQRLLDQAWLQQVDRSKGRFRSFLLTALRHLLTNEWHRANRQKRGGGVQHLSIDGAAAEDRYAAEPVDPVTPDRLFERRWAETLLARVLERMEAEYRNHPLGFANLKVFLVDRKGAVRFGEAAAQLGVTESALKSVVHKVRDRYRHFFLEEIAQTLGPGESIEEEARALLAALES